jgi:2-hydroxy-6-oxonona-2,4-dienedioate hydrolase
MSIATTSIIVVAAGVLWLYLAYRRDLNASRQKLQGASQIIGTVCGPIEYTEAGEGPPILIIHGAGGGFDQGMEIGRLLVSHGFRVIAMSRFGYLRTPLPVDASPAAQADAHAALMTALGIARAAIVGGSAGAPSAMQFAIRHPSLCSALVLVVPITYKPPGIAASAPRVSPWAEKVLMTIVGSDLAFWLASKAARNIVINRVLATPPEAVSSASRDEQTRVGRILNGILPISNRSKGILNDARISASIPRFDLENIKAPTFVVSVRDDLYGTFAGAQYTAQQIQGARFAGYDNGGHMWVGHNDQLMAEIVAFLKPHNGLPEIRPPEK